MLTKHIPVKKLKPIPEKGSLWDCYRGDYSIIWSGLFINNKLSELFASGCKWCDQWWGWTFDLKKAKKNSFLMTLKGCPLCKDRLSEKQYKRLRLAIKKRSLKNG